MEAGGWSKELYLRFPGRTDFLLCRKDTERAELGMKELKLSELENKMLSRSHPLQAADNY